jgi:hypothetical protein
MPSTLLGFMLGTDAKNVVVCPFNFQMVGHAQQLLKSLYAGSHVFQRYSGIAVSVEPRTIVRTRKV